MLPSWRRGGAGIQRRAKIFTDRSVLITARPGARRTSRPEGPQMNDPGVDLQLDRAHSARMYDYYLGGTTNFPADREAVSRVITAFPQVLIASRANRAFMRRATAYLAEHGLRQFL